MTGGTTEVIAMASEITIRAFEPGDLAAIAELNNLPLAVTGTLGIPLQSTLDVERRFTIDASNRMLVAEIDGKVVGCAGLNMNRGRRAHSGSIGMAVRDDFQGRGVGTALMYALMDLADNWYNLLRLDLQVYTDNEAGIHLYQRFGFVIEGTLRSYAYRDGEFADAYYMARLRNCPPILRDTSTMEQMTIDEAG
jgi:L-phenylalanine/L-methionine N-acetyltransferase